MEFYCLSISHQTTSLDIREQLSCAQPELGAVLASYAAQPDGFLNPASEIAILSTCNRFELYLIYRNHQHPFAGRPEQVRQGLLAYLRHVTGYTGPDLAGFSVFYQDLSAVEHLMRVTCGLESQVIGEAQIIGQVSDALKAALQAGSARHTLASLFRAALHTAKRAHTETAIGRSPASLSSVAASIAEQMLGNLNQQTVVVIGAGEMSTLAVRAFHARGVKNLTVVNRSYANAVQLAQQYGYQAGAWEDLDDILGRCKVALSATGSQHPILTADRLQEIQNRRGYHPILLLDIALPRDIDPVARDLPGVTLVDLDDIQRQLHHTLDQRRNEAVRVEAIVQEELRAFAHWIEVIPTVGKLHRKAEQIRQQEVERTLQHLPDLDPHVHEQIELMTRSLVKKLFHEPSTRMRNDVKNGELSKYISSLHFLFGLDDDDAQIRE